MRDSVATGAASEVQALISGGGVKYWLLRSPDSPVVAIRFSFFGGSWLDGLDAADKTSKRDTGGRVNFLSLMLTEGAGKWKSEDFQAMLDENAISLSYASHGERLSGSLVFLKRKQAMAIEAIRVSLREPRFDEHALERTRAEMIANARSIEYLPNLKARHEWQKWQFEGTPFAKPDAGTVSSIKGLKREDLSEFLEEVLGRDNLKVSIVGDLGEEEAGEIIDTISGDFHKAAKISNPEFRIELKHSGEIKKISHKSVQDKMVFGLTLMGAKSADYHAALLLSRYIGHVPNGLFFKDVREKLGLAYSVNGNALVWQGNGLFMGTADVSAGTWRKALEAIKGIFGELEEGKIDGEVMERIRQHYLKSWVTRFISSEAIGASMHAAQVLGLSTDEYQDTLQRVEAVSNTELERVAKKYFNFSRFGTLVLVPSGADGGSE